MLSITIFKILETDLLIIKNVSEIGVGLAGFGIAFLFLGVLLLFDKGLLAIGNVSILLTAVQFSFPKDKL